MIKGLLCNHKFSGAMKHEVYRDKKCLITGASSGLGKELALQLGKLGAELVLTDIQEDKLLEVVQNIRDAGGKLLFFRSMDVADYEQVQYFAQDVHGQFGAMDMVMNVAGIAIWGSVDNMKHQEWKRIVDVNLMGPIHIVETFIPPMIAAKRGGRLVNVASVAALFGLPWHAAYCASKYGIRGMSDVLRHDLHQHNIKVHLVCPGGMDTEMVGNISIAGIDTQSEKFEAMRKQFRMFAVSSTAAAKAVLAGISNEDYHIFTSADMKAVFWIENRFGIVSDWFMQKANDYFQKKLKEV